MIESNNEKNKKNNPFIPFIRVSLYIAGEKSSEYKNVLVKIYQPEQIDSIWDTGTAHQKPG